MSRAAILVSLAMHGAVCAAVWQWAAARPVPARGSEGMLVALPSLIEEEGSEGPAAELPVFSVPVPPPLSAPAFPIVTTAADAPAMALPPAPFVATRPAPPHSSAAQPRRGRAGGSASGAGSGAPLACTPPSYRRAPAPAYPPAARARRLAGIVLLRVSVDAGGHVEAVAVKRSSGHTLLDDAAVRAVRAWEFQPARIGRQAVAAQVEVPVRFLLPERAV